jgi:hypothetical protein
MENNLDQRFTELDGFPSADDPELTELMIPVGRMPRDRVDTMIETTVMCALAYKRTGNPEFMTMLASSALVTLRSRRDSEDQKALDAAPRARQASGTGSDLDEVFARLGLRLRKDR